MIDAARISFRPVTRDDLPLLGRWMETAHWRQWWGEAETELGQIRDMVEGRDTTRPFLFLLDDRPAGYIQIWYVGDHLCEPFLTQAPWMRNVPADSVGVDLSIGEAADLSRGLGSAALGAFVRRLVAEGHDSIIIDPDAANARAVRAYEKAGFRPFLVSPDPGGNAAQATLIMTFAGNDAAPSHRTQA
ncbi:aminoglycoside 6'-N-acetyltransferase [Hoeflea marina]|uniref:Aminoglycoside 6'-N-acetyltransferase n=1 Tax=Hoeflea marina TaxID=274592 RepID=A0A317PLP2_9HYPH|nr:GNAT family N-acetyltransferase [Hoeflea marina]PWW00535.1 aminoglycoside 6'-N-acetyltransferase [Hoeflea marina]